MFWRKWLVRGLVFSLLGGFLAVGYLYQRWTNPAAVRRQVIAKLRELFPGAEVTLDSAHLRLLGGIALNELRLTRKDDPDKTDLACLPSAVLYHDKEQLLHGKLTLRKVEMQRPRLRIVRNPRGTWNLAGLTGPSRPGTALPTIVVHQGTLVLEDQQASPGSLPLEISDVNLTILNDPVPVVAFEGSGKSDLFGTLHVRGTWQRETNEVALTLDAAQVPLGPALVQRVGCYCPDTCAHVRGLEGQGELHARLHYHCGLPRPCSYDLLWLIHQGKLSHPLLPVGLDQLEAQVRCQNGLLTVEKLTARAGTAPVRLSRAWLTQTSGGLAFEVRGQVEHLQVNDELFSRLPEMVKQYQFQELYHPSGPTTAVFHLARQDGQWREHHWVIRPEGMSGWFCKFPYALDRIRGSLDFDLCRHKTKIDLTGFTGDRQVQIEGSCQGEGNKAEAKFHVYGLNIPLDEKLVRALPANLKELARAFHARGQGDFDIYFNHLPGPPQYTSRYLARFHHTSLRWDVFPYPLEEATGLLDIQPTQWVLRDFQGRHHGGVIRANGYSYPLRSNPGPADHGVAVQIAGAGVALDDDLKKALAPFPGLAQAWTCFQPTGQLNFTAKIAKLPEQPQDLDVALDVRGCTILPAFFPYALTDLSGNFHYCKNRLQLTGIRARHGASRVALANGYVLLPASGEVYADLKDLRAGPLVPDASFKKAMPGPLKSACETLHIDDPVSLETRLVVSVGAEPGSRPVVFWDGIVRLADAHLQVGLPIEKVSGWIGCRGRHNGTDLEGVTGNFLLDRAALFNQPFQMVHCHFVVNEKAPDVVVLGLSAPVFGGQISGEGRVELTSTLRYELNLHATEIHLDAFGRHNIGPDAHFDGLVSGGLFLEGKGNGIQSLEGKGQLDMPRGRLYNLPLLLDLLKFLGLRWPDRTAFEQAHAAFTIQGDQVRFSQLDLVGNAISLHGQGDMKLDGTDIRLDFIPVWGRIEQVLPPIWQPIPSTIGKNLLKIEMRGKVGREKDLQFHKKPVPGLLGPLYQMRDWVVGTLNPRQGSPSGGPAPENRAPAVPPAPVPVGP